MELVKISHKSGVSNLADPTVWDKFEIEFPFKIEVTLVGTWEAVAFVYHKGKEILFISSMVHSWLFPIIERIYNYLWEKEYSYQFDEEWVPDYPMVM